MSKLETKGRVRLAAMIPFAMLLTACGEKPVLVLPPATLAECADEPVAPILPGRDQQDLRDSLTLDYLLAMRSAWGDCRAKVDGLRAWMDAAGE